MNRKLLLIAISILFIGIFLGYFSARKLIPTKIDLSPADSVKIIEAANDKILKAVLLEVDKRISDRNVQYKIIKELYEKDSNRIYNADEQRRLYESIKSTAERARNLRDSTRM